MAKKSRRAKKRAKKKRSIPVDRPGQPAPVSGPTVAKEIEARAEERSAKLAEEYRYVYSDLKRIAILAGVMLAALIVLSFVIG
jgi:hypothetical protein